VIEQTIRKKLPAGFQNAEFQLEHGFVDNIVDRRRQAKYIAQLLQMHRRGQA
jgi:acetyl-CoA carboxylase carboxyl transferase subunit beta